MAVVLFPMVSTAALEELRREEVVMPPLEIAADEISFPLGNGALLLDESLDDEVMLLVEEVMGETLEELEGPVPVGPAEETVLLPIMKTAELDETGLEEEARLLEAVVEMATEVLEDPAPVGPAEGAVLLPIANGAELEELKLEGDALLMKAVELVMVMF